LLPNARACENGDAAALLTLFDGCRLCHGHRLADGRDFSNFVKRQERQFPRWRCRFAGRDHLVGHRREPEHLNAKRIRTVFEAREAIAALNVRGCDERLTALRRGDRRARNRQAVEVDLAMLIGCGKHGCPRQGEQQRSG
jgi:hypothetical protein